MESQPRGQLDYLPTQPEHPILDKMSVIDRSMLSRFEGRFLKPERALSNQEKEQRLERLHFDRIEHYCLMLGIKEASASDKYKGKRPKVKNIGDYDDFLSRLSRYAWSIIEDADIRLNNELLPRYHQLKKAINNRADAQTIFKVYSIVILDGLAQEAGIEDRVFKAKLAELLPETADIDLVDIRAAARETITPLVEEKPGETFLEELHAAKQRLDVLSTDYATDSKTMYVHEANKIDNIDEEQALWLFQRIEKKWLVGADFSVEMDMVTTANLRLGYAYVERMTNLAGRPPTGSFMDSVQEANIALIRAMQMYDFRYGVRPSTMATTYIKNGLRLARYAEYGTGVTQMAAQLYERYMYFRGKFISEKGYNPSIAEWAQAAGVDKDWLRKFLNEEAPSARRIVSLDKPLSEDDDSSETLADIVPTEEEGFYAVERGTLGEALFRAIMQQPGLNNAQRELLIWQNGGHPEHRHRHLSGQQLGEIKNNVSRETIRKRITPAYEVITNPALLSPGMLALREYYR